MYRVLIPISNNVRAAPTAPISPISALAQDNVKLLPPLNTMSV